MMFAYVFYVPLLPLVAFACYIISGRKAGELYLFNISTVFALCFCGFILLPLKTQLFYMPEAYSIPLEGGIFAQAGEWIRATQHFPGGALPSPHTAASTVMLIFTYRYARKYLYLVLPIVITIYVATVYGRYHYIWDSITGIITAMLTVRLTPKINQLVANYLLPFTGLVPETSRFRTEKRKKQIPNTQEV
jgi:membrane-associated phospholipid phosphatase